MPPTRSTKGKRKDHGIDIEALAQQKARYFIVHGEESEFLAADPTARDKAIAALYQNPNMKKASFPCVDALVGPNDDSDVFLKAIDELLDNPLKTIEQRVIRLHVAVSGLLVFNEKKLYPAVAGRKDLERKVMTRSHQIYQEWASKNLPPPSGSGISTIPTQEPLTPPPSRVPSSSMTPMTSDTAEALLARPLNMLNKKFIHEANTPDSGAWEIESYTTKKSGEVVYNVLFEDCDDAIPHDADGMRILLRDSHVTL